MTENNSATKTEQEAPAASPSRMDEATGFLVASLDSMTPAIMQRMTATMAKAAELVDLIDVINTDEMRGLVTSAAEAAESLSRSLEAVKALEESGALSALVEMGDFAYAMKQSMTASILTRTLSSGISLAVTGDQMLAAARESVKDAKKDTRKLGPVTLLNTLKEPKIQEGLKFMLAFAQRLPDLMEGI